MEANVRLTKRGQAVVNYAVMALFGAVMGIIVGVTYILQYG
jgi:hypothetical protein